MAAPDHSGFQDGGAGADSAGQAPARGLGGEGSLVKPFEKQQLSEGHTDSEASISLLSLTDEVSALAWLHAIDRLADKMVYMSVSDSACMQAFMTDSAAGKQGVLLASLGTIAELGGLPRYCSDECVLGYSAFEDKCQLNIWRQFLLTQSRAM